MSSSSSTSKPTGGWAKKRIAIEKQRKIEQDLPKLQATAAAMFKLNPQPVSADYRKPVEVEIEITEQSGLTRHKISDEIDDVMVHDTSQDNESDPDDEIGKPKVKKIKGKGKYRQDWEKQFPWLTYNEIDGKAYCKFCESYKYLSNKLTKGVDDFSHVTGVKGTWASHDKSNDHNIALTHYALGNKDGILQQVCDQGIADALKGRRALLIMFDTIRTSLRQNLPLRGHTHSESNFDQLMNLLTRHQEDLRWWFERKHRTKFTSGDVIMEITSLIGVSTMRLISTHLRGRKFAFMIDETPDLQGVEQIAVIVRTVNNNLEIEETFLGWHATIQKDAGSLVTLIEDSLRVYHMDIENDCVGQVLDGAATMVGKLSGVKTRIKCKHPQALFIYCAGHALNLVLKQGVIVVPPCEHAMSVVGRIAKHVKRTSGWKLFQAERQRGSDERKSDQGKDDDEGDSDSEDDGWIDFCMEMIGKKKPIKTKSSNKQPTVKLLSDTRWLCNEGAVSSILNNYSSLLDYFTQSLRVDEETCVQNSHQAKAREFVNLLDNYRTYYSLRVLQDAYSVINPVHRIIQSPILSILTVRDLIRTTRDRLSAKANDWIALTAFYEKAKTEADEMGLEAPILERAARRGRKSQVMTALQEEQLLLVQHASTIHRAILLEMVAGIDRKYDIADLTMVGHMENALFLDDDVDPSLQALHSNIDWSMFKSERDILRACLTSHGKDFKMAPILEIMRSEIGQALVQYRALLVIVLTLPTTVCTAERSFSGLNRIKTKLRTTLSQKGMNAYAVCHLNKSFTDELDLNAVADEFIRSRDTRSGLCATSEQIREIIK